MTSTPYAELEERLLQEPMRMMEPMEQELFLIRMRLGLPDIERPLRLLYGQRPDFESWRDQFLLSAARAYSRRSLELRHLDLARQSEPDWFQNPAQVGYVCYTDRFAGDLQGLRGRIDYLQELGVTYLHLMPLLQTRDGANDGGYAVKDYRQVRDDLGSIEELSQVAADLRAAGISLCIDFVCNHTAEDHEWAQKAVAGDPYYQAYYHTFPDRKLPDQYELTIREIFPDFKSGSFTYNEQMERWVWTTFNDFQWDLNYANPAVFGEMLAAMLYLANHGVEVLRLDAVAFMWKRLGTDCENQPEAHAILQAFRALTRLAAPGLLLLAEAIVSPVQVIPYLGRGEATNKECELAYHNVLMVMLWSSLAERKVALLTHAMQRMPSIPSRTSWLTYVRCHDDIGWAVTEEDAAGVGLNGYLHRSFLSDFYSGRFPGSFSRGATFQFNPRTNDRRISGACASLAGLEIALEEKDAAAQEWAIGRILLVHSMILAYGGLPLIYMGDEIGMLNDKSYLEQPELAADNRWMHRPPMDWEAAQERHNLQTPAGRIFRGMAQLVWARKETLALHAEARALPVWTHNEHIFGLLRESRRGQVLVLGNFSELSQSLPASRLSKLGFGGRLRNAIDGAETAGWRDLLLPPFGSVWLESVE